MRWRFGGSGLPSPFASDVLSFGAEGMESAYVPADSGVGAAYAPPPYEGNARTLSHRVPLGSRNSGAQVLGQRGINLDMRDHPAASDPGLLATHGLPQFHEGQQVWLNRRQATFIYYASAQAATIRYHDEHTTRIVPVSRLAATPPADS